MKSWPHFAKDELYNSHWCDEHLMEDTFMDKLEDLRIAYGKPMVINSAYRTADHNEHIGGSKNSAHISGRAVDVKIDNVADAFKLTQLAMGRGFTGIGVKETGDHDTRFIHLDDMPNGIHPRPAMWSY